VVSTEIYIVETERDVFSHTLTLGEYALHCTGMSKTEHQNYGLFISAHRNLEPIILMYRDICQILNGSTGWLMFMGANLIEMTKKIQLCTTIYYSIVP